MIRAGTLQKVAAIVLIGIAAALYLARGRPGEKRGPGPSIMPDVGASIRLVVCTVNSARRAMLRNADLVTGIVNALPARVHFLLIVNDPAAFTVASNPYPERVRFINLPAETSITIWPQDPFVVLTDADGNKSVLVSRTFDRVGDRQIPYAIAKELRWPCRDSALSFEGGNIVADERHAFVGANTIRHNGVTLEQDEAEIVRQFERELGRPVLVVGPVPQPIGHVDMMLTPLGDQRLMLADPGRGATLAEQELTDSPNRVAAFEASCEKMFFGTPAIQELRDLKGHVVRPPQVVGQTRKAIDDSRAVAGQLDRLAEELSARGYQVIRIPYLFVRREPAQREQGRSTTRRVTTATAPSDPNSAGDQEEEWGAPKYPELTYNNVLLETVEGRRIVYLPQYGWEALDSDARRVWQENGCEVHAVDGFAISAMYGGSLRCCVKVLGRD